MSKKCAAFLLLSASLTMSPAAQAGGSVGGTLPTIPSTSHVTPHVVVPTFVAQPAAPAPVSSAPVVIPHAASKLTTTPPFPLDLTHALPALSTSPPPLIFDGLEKVEDGLAYTGGAGEMEAGAGTVFQRLADGSVQLSEGTLLVFGSSQHSLVRTPAGTISLGQGQALISFSDGVLRVANIGCLGKRCRISLPGTGNLALAAGFELVAGSRTLSPADLHPGDSVGRRHLSLVAERMAVSQFSVDSLLNSSPLTAGMAGRDDKATHSKLNNMSKMGAVLGYIYGTDGYESNSLTAQTEKLPQTSKLLQGNTIASDKL